MRILEGSALNEAGDEWVVSCDCGKDIEYQGFFDTEDMYTCPNCKVNFRIKRIWFDDSRYGGRRKKNETLEG